MTDETPTLRRASRVVLLDESNRVLLVRFEYGGRRWWATPGGALEGEETHEDAARREIEEETGLRLKAPGPWVWNREHVFRFEGRLYRQRERYFVAVVPAFTPRPGALGPEESIAFRDLCWWTLQELQAGTDVFAPADLPALVRRLVEQGPPNDRSRSASRPDASAPTSSLDERRSIGLVTFQHKRLLPGNSRLVGRDYW